MFPLAVSSPVTRHINPLPHSLSLLLYSHLSDINTSDCVDCSQLSLRVPPLIRLVWKVWNNKREW